VLELRVPIRMLPAHDGLLRGLKAVLVLMQQSRDGFMLDANPVRARTR
jgi:hypothetical protein